MYIYIDLILTDLVGNKLLPDLKYFKQSETKYKMVNHGKPSLMWNYFTWRNKDAAICNICSKIYGTKGSSTSTLKKHLAIHKEEYEEYSLNQAERDRAYSAVKDKKNVNKAEDLFGKPT